jgi:outer membrane receptor protein involved in Fe transport
VANLLAPASGGVLSPNISQNEYGRLFQRNGVGLSSTTEYYSCGDFVERGAQFGTFGHVSYALEADYRSENGTRLNEDFRQLTFAAKVKLELTPQDSLYLQGIYYDAESGDVSQYYDPLKAQSWLRVKEKQDPMLLAGYHHEWSPGVHTLLLAGRLQDTLEYNDPNQSELLVVRNAAGQVSRVSKPVLPVAPLDYESEFTACTAELQQIWQQERHTLVAGGRYQAGDFDTQSRLGASTPTRLGNSQSTLPFTFASPPIAQDLSSDFQRVSVYAYENVRLLEPVLLTAGVSYDRLTYPLNHRLAPISSSVETTDSWSPKAGLIWSVASNTSLRGSFTRSLGGVSYDQSFRLEPTQVAGFNQTYRNLISESLVGTAPAPTFETWGVALDQQCGRGTYFLAQAEWLNSGVDRTIGAIDVGGPPTTYTTSQILQQLDYRERNLSVGISQLLGQDWSVGARYRLTDSELLTRFPAIAPTVTPAASTDQEATLHQVTMYAQYAHSCGGFGSFESIWTQQSNRGYSPDLPGDDFWQFNVFVGYRFLRRQAELKLGLLNLTGQDYRLNPLNFHPEYYRDRTLMLSCRLFF